MRSADGGELLFAYVLADRLGKTVGEITSEMSVDEREGWVAYLKREADFRRAEQR
jgi:hypothetical protein